MQEVQTTLPVGSIVGGRYLVEKLLGKGGFGAVYLVRDRRVKQNLFALKEVIDPHKLERKRFVFEAELLRRLDHPALPRVYRVFEDEQNDRAYMLMDFVDGPNLEVLRRHQPGKRFSVQQVLSIMGPIMEAITYLHTQQPPIIHRDVKPSNIIVPTSGDEAMLVDFGIAKEFDPEATTTAVRHASPGYGAPEQYGMGTNTRTDIYGLGATIYTLLTGVVPPDAFYRITQLGSKGTDPLEPILQYAPDVPQHIADAIYRAMAVDANGRFPTAQEFWTALNAQPLSHQPPAAPLVIPGPVVPQSNPAVASRPFENATTLAERTPPAGRRRRNGALLLLLLALLVGIASVSLLVFALVGHRGANPTITPTAGVVHHPAATATHKPTATPAPSHSPASSNPSPAPTTGSSIPTLNGAYNGSIHNTPANETASMSLSSIKQNGGNIQGVFVVGQPLAGNGNFSGTINASGSMQFTVHSQEVGAPLFFQGNRSASGSLSGTYCSLDNTGQCNPAAGGYGTWNVSPVALGSGSSSIIFPSLAAALNETLVWCQSC